MFKNDEGITKDSRVFIVLRNSFVPCSVRRRIDQEITFSASSDEPARVR
jgi:hypothetical protein